MSKSFDEIVEDFHNNHEVEYELRVIIDGEVFVKSTSSIDIYDVVSDADNLQDKVNEHAMDDERDRLEYIAEAQAEAQMQEELDNKSVDLSGNT